MKLAVHLSTRHNSQEQKAKSILSEKCDVAADVIP